MDQSPVMHHPDPARSGVAHEANASGVSWAAVVAGAVATAALSLILLSLGAGLGLSAVSPWTGVGASSAAIGSAVIVWLILMQVMSGSMGGYLAGRLRTRWASVHTDEVYFRDTAHGFLSWALAVVVTAASLATAATAMVGSATAAPHGGSAMAEAGGALDANAYYVDLLFRSSPPAPDSVGAVTRGEARRILVAALAEGNATPSDRAYIAKLIATRTGLSGADADKRFSDVLAGAQAAADAVRKATAHSLLWIFAALLIGAFCSSVSATIGGRQRDHVIIL